MILFLVSRGLGPLGQNLDSSHEFSPPLTLQKISPLSKKFLAYSTILRSKKTSAYDLASKMILIPELLQIKYFWLYF